jgi:hypothetical protein
MKVRFLLDENQSPRLKTAIIRLIPSADVLRVGDSTAPALSTPDMDLLRYLELTRRALITADRTTIPTHLEAHRMAGGLHWGIFWVRPRMPIGRLTESLQIIWEASEADDWINQENWIPF